MADTYDILGIAQRTKLVPGMGFAEVEEVTFRTKPEGIVSTVTIAKDQATPDTVNATVAAEVDRLHGIKRL